VTDKGIDNFVSRRRLLRLFGFGTLSLALPFGLRAAGTGSLSMPGRDDEMPPDGLGAADEHGLRLLPGYQSRIVARSGQQFASGYIWHAAPDGGATLTTKDGGWIYVSNSEVDHHGGGVGSLRFAADGSIIDAYRILSGTSRNCAGSMTPWGRYLSCEEVNRGQVWECDPFGKRAAQARPALGRFIHESVIVDPHSRQLYLTEDHPEGRLYRFTAAQNDGSGHPDLRQGLLKVAQVVDDEKGHRLVWHPVPDPMARRRPTRTQVKDSTPFNGGEGVCSLDGLICFVTKGDNRVWGYDPVSHVIRVLYDDDFHSPAILRGVDNLITTPAGDLLVSEDGDDMQLITLTLSGRVQPFLQLTGHQHSELTGLAYSPDGRHLYVSSQRGRSGRKSDGVVFEVRRSG